MTRCKKCGALIADIGDTHNCNIENKENYQPHLHSCQHCYCKRGLYINNQEHFVCCMCGHRTLVNKVTY